MKTKAFTLIELIVVTSIIILISGSGVFYFADSLKNQEGKQRIATLEDKFSNLDRDVQNYEIFDYTLSFDTSKGKLGYLVSKNVFDPEEALTLDFDFTNGSGTLSTLSSTGNLLIQKEGRIYANIPLPLEAGFSSEITLWEGRSYTITGISSTIEIHYFSDSDARDIEIEAFSLGEINTQSDGNGTPYSRLLVQNIGGKKTIRADDTEVPEVYLIFEYNGKKSSMRID